MIEEEKEIWKTIEGYPNYQISNLGRVKSIERKVKSNNGYRIIREKILKPSKHRDGYLKINLFKDGEKKTMQLHRLVAKAFVQNDSLFNNEVNHKNECKTDNRACNLEWCDSTYNNNYGTRNIRAGISISKAKKGIYNTKHSKLVKCLETGVIYPSVSEVNRQLGFSKCSISECCNGKAKSCGGFHWQYA